jgi:hypothetical protein
MRGPGCAGVGGDPEVVGPADDDDLVLVALAEANFGQLLPERCHGRPRAAIVGRLLDVVADRGIDRGAPDVETGYTAEADAGGRPAGDPVVAGVGRDQGRVGVVVVGGHDADGGARYGDVGAVFASQGGDAEVGVVHQTGRPPGPGCVRADVLVDHVVVGARVERDATIDLVVDRPRRPAVGRLPQPMRRVGGVPRRPGIDRRRQAVADVRCSACDAPQGALGGASAGGERPGGEAGIVPGCPLVAGMGEREIEAAMSV